MKNIKLLLSLGAVALLAACSDPRPPEEIVAERAQARWDALLNRDFEQAWEYYSPGFREQTASVDFAVDRSRRPVRWKNAKVIDIKCEDKRCETTVRVDYSVPGAPGPLSGVEVSRDLAGIWIEIDGKWWYAKQ